MICLEEWMIFELNNRIFNIMIWKGNYLYMINLFACTLNEFDFVKSARSFLNFFFFCKKSGGGKIVTAKQISNPIGIRWITEQ